MDITSSSLAHLALGSSLPGGWPASSGADEQAHDAASWFHADASAARITMPAAAPDATTDVAGLAQRVLAHLAA